eukprot:1749039-Prymnesium_polylepis.1
MAASHYLSVVSYFSLTPVGHPVGHPRNSSRATSGQESTAAAACRRQLQSSVSRCGHRESSSQALHNCAR